MVFTPNHTSMSNGDRAGEDPSFLVIDRVSKRFHDGPTPVTTLREISFRVGEGELVCLLGPSGSGKSTLLRIVAGLLASDAGDVWLRTTRLRGPHPEIGVVFQSTNLMPWRTVLQNVLLPLEVRGDRPGAADRARALALLATVGLADFAHVYPKQLSGGMAQRAVLARTLIQEPRLLLMDEPFGALDALTRERLNLELLRIHRLQRQTVLMVTHSITEAVFLADRVLVLSQRPAQVLAHVAIDLPRPRRLEMMGDERFGRLTTDVRRHLGQLTGEDWGRDERLGESAP